MTLTKKTDAEWLELAVAKVFRWIGGGMNRKQAIKLAAYDYAISREQLEEAYNKAIDIAAESD